MPPAAVAAPLDIVHPIARMKSMSFRPTRSKRPSSPPHPLEDEPLSDTDTEYSLDYSSCSTASSVAESLSAPSPSSLRSASSPPVLLPCLASATRVSPPEASTKSKLTELLSKSQHQSSQANKKTSFQPVQTVAGHKATARSSWQMFSAFVIGYSMTRRNSETRFMPKVEPEPLFDFEADDDAYVEKELTTFSERKSTEFGPLAAASKARNREYRINSDFLKRYALDCAARANGVLPGLSGSPVHTSPALQNFNNVHGLHKYSEMSKDKLWNSVVLPPRADPCPRHTIDHEQFTFVGELPSITAKNSKVVPWAAHQSSLKPAGALTGCKCLRSETSPTSGATTPQYTIKGWQSTRWAELE